ncbi:MAG: endo alpha-1,4 polygalactosaminidase [Lentisphaerae bacterium]|nr:endo alpha-1,4 polygalactosaminidase [Lentisphaerota bacterium]
MLKPEKKQLIPVHQVTSRLLLLTVAALLVAGCDRATQLGDVEFWAYQIQGIGEPGVVDSLARSRYDMLVLEPTRTDWSSDDRDFNTRGMVTRLKATLGSDGSRRKLVIAYLDIGEAEDWRWYWTWSQSWSIGASKPADWPEYILAHDPDGWEGNYPVAYWDDEWKDIMIYGRDRDSSPHGDYSSALDEVIRDGFDGVYLDWVEAYEDSDVRAAAARDGVDAAEEMIRFIGEIRRYARSRKPGFLVIQQNAASLIDAAPGLLSVIDAIAQEAVWFDGDATDDWDDGDGYDWENDADLVDYYVSYLARYQSRGVPVFNCEYALRRSAEAYSRSKAEGYVPYVTRRSLGRLTTTPPE